MGKKRPKLQVLHYEHNPGFDYERFMNLRSELKHAFKGNRVKYKCDYKFENLPELIMCDWQEILETIEAGSIDVLLINPNKELFASMQDSIAGQVRTAFVVPNPENWTRLKGVYVPDEYQGAVNTSFRLPLMNYGQHDDIARFVLDK